MIIYYAYAKDSMYLKSDEKREFLLLDFLPRVWLEGAMGQKKYYTVSHWEGSVGGTLGEATSPLTSWGADSTVEIPLTRQALWRACPEVGKSWRTSLMEESLGVVQGHGCRDVELRREAEWMVSEVGWSSGGRTKPQERSLCILPWFASLEPKSPYFQYGSAHCLYWLLLFGRTC